MARPLTSLLCVLRYTIPQGQDKVSRIGFVAGTIPADKVMGFERLLFRATRGNMFLRQGSVGEVKDPITNETVSKHVFVIFFAGDRSRTKIMKVRKHALPAFPLNAVLLWPHDCGHTDSPTQLPFPVDLPCWLNPHLPYHRSARPSAPTATPSRTTRRASARWTAR